MINLTKIFDIIDDKLKYQEQEIKRLQRVIAENSKPIISYSLVREEKDHDITVLVGNELDDIIVDKNRYYQDCYIQMNVYFDNPYLKDEFRFKLTPFDDISNVFTFTRLMNY